MHVFRKLPRRRRGVSLLEVLVSIGVTSVGLLGVLALIPLGGAQTRQGQVLERSPVIGLSAFAEIRNRDMLASGNWITAAGIAPTSSYQVAFCLDPLTVASGGSSIFPPQATANMARLSLWNGRTDLGPPNTTADTNKIMTLPMAETIFRSQDDLRLEVLSSDRTAPPTQIWKKSIDPADEATRRQAEGTMSWMATVFPNRAQSSPSDLFTVSVVVFNRRVIDTVLKTEFTATVTNAPGAGISGGDMVIEFDTSVYSQEEIREAKTPDNSWVLLSGITKQSLFTGAFDQNGAPINDNLRVFEWYRVIASDSALTNERQITLAGPDWPVDQLNTTQVTIIPGTVAVYQKNIRLEGASLWRN